MQCHTETLFSKRQRNDFYTCDDIAEMKVLLAKLANLPDKGEMTDVKLGLFGSSAKVRG